MRTSIIALLSAATLAVPAVVLADGGPSQPNQPPGTPPPAIAALLCKVEAAKAGTDASGSDSLAACVKQELPTVTAALASCKSAASRDDMKACVAKAIGLPAPNELPGAGGDQQNGQNGQSGQSGSGQSGQGQGQGGHQGGPGQGGHQGGPGQGGRGGQGGPGQGRGRGNGKGRPGGQQQNRR